jgi:hypothetical protein
MKATTLLNRAPGASRGSHAKPLNRALDASRGSRPANTITTGNKETPSAHTPFVFPSPVAVRKWGGGGAESARRRGSSLGARNKKGDKETASQTAKVAQRRLAPSPACGGGGERSEAEGVFEPTQQPHASNAHNPSEHPTLPKDTHIGEFIDAFLDGSFDLTDLCTRFQLAPQDLLTFLESPSIQALFETLERIATLREKAIAAQSRVVAAHRLSELAKYAHTADKHEARAFETARTAATKCLRTSQENTRPRLPCPRTSRRHAITQQSNPDPQSRPPTTQSLQTTPTQSAPPARTPTPHPPQGVRPPHKPTPKRRRRSLLTRPRALSKALCRTLLRWSVHRRANVITRVPCPRASRGHECDTKTTTGARINDKPAQNARAHHTNHKTSRSKTRCPTPYRPGITGPLGFFVGLSPGLG